MVGTAHGRIQTSTFQHVELPPVWCMVRTWVKFISKTFDIFGDRLVARALGHPPAHDCRCEVLVIMISWPGRIMLAMLLSIIALLDQELC